jgi:ferritin-like metal-binding protein YciE
MSFDLSLLGVEENVPKIEFTEYTGLLQAMAKWGKTTFATLYDNCVLLACEPGYKAKKLNFRKIERWEDFINFIDLLESHREEVGENVKTLAVDTVDRLYPYCQQYMVKQYNLKKSKDAPKVDSIGDIPHGKGWSSADEEFLKQIMRPINLGFTYLFITHSVLKTIRPKVGDPYDVYVPTLPDRCAAIIYPLVDFIINGERVVVKVDGEDVKKRAINLRGNEMAEGGSRVGNISEKIVFDTEEEAMDLFRASFREAIEKEVRKDNADVDMDKLAADQKKQKDDKVKETLGKVRELPEIVKDIKKTMKSGLKDGKLDNAKIVALLGKHEIKAPDEITTVDSAKKILEDLNKLITEVKTN